MHSVHAVICPQLNKPRRHLMLTRQQLSTIFHIYAEASLAVLLAFCGLIEMACALVIDSPFQLFALAASSLFLITATCVALIVYRKAKANNHI
jgi:hypothetical protein